MQLDAHDIYSTKNVLKDGGETTIQIVLRSNFDNEDTEYE